MADLTRRSLLGAAALAGLPASIARAAMIAPDVRKGTIEDVAHVVILMQENRSFDHYFGTLRGVRGFGDRFPIPLAPVDGRQRAAWEQQDRAEDGAEHGKARLTPPFHLDTQARFDVMRIAGTPHTWPDAHAAWDQGRMGNWPEAKTRRAMGHYRREDIPFQFALAETFTICDAYHCAIQTGTNSNRLFLWSGTNDPHGTHGGPAIGNSHDNFPEQGGAADDYLWTTVPERLQAAGIDWRIYQDMADNFTDNPLVGFRAYRKANQGAGDPALRERALTTQALDRLRGDVLGGTLPQVSWIIADAVGSEHPGPSSPAQGALYTAQVLDALTADPRVWARTVLLVMFDENDGFFDHVPPPAPPSFAADGSLLGASGVDTAGEYHRHAAPGEKKIDEPRLRGRPYGLGPRVPMYVVSPWSRGGWVNSQVFDHTSVIRFLETRFGFEETNISPWRRAVCGDLTSAFDFSAPDRAPFGPLPDPRADALRAAQIASQPDPAPPAEPHAFGQEPGVRRSRALPYRLEVTERIDSSGPALRFAADGAAAVFHVYDRSALSLPPRRYTVAKGQRIDGLWDWDDQGGYDLWVLGPGGFHRHFAGRRDDPVIGLSWHLSPFRLELQAEVEGLRLHSMRTATPLPQESVMKRHAAISLRESLGWYDVLIETPGSPHWRRRLAGRVDLEGRETTSDPFRTG
ncbi:phosphocholine-specific phospholipase C [Novosphingobium sp. TCA1]|uniref:phosphocholine-specific phospholipase C n=1 Tax=Novosphingobium sp. TCA1 TaxID=2682474 RepID=UPI0013070BF6|nr:phospholipase C, phosphocholine-specific [Novosphingobium sp. TCA1]GFE77383.1 phospholipase C [Novosphingobium sp. TCA1]